MPSITTHTTTVMDNYSPRVLPPHTIYASLSTLKDIFIFVVGYNTKSVAVTTSAMINLDHLAGLLDTVNPLDTEAFIQSMDPEVWSANAMMLPTGRFVGVYITLGLVQSHLYPYVAQQKSYGQILTFLACAVVPLVHSPDILQHMAYLQRYHEVLKTRIMEELGSVVRCTINMTLQPQYKDSVQLLVNKYTDSILSRNVPYVNTPYHPWDSPTVYITRSLIDLISWSCGLRFHSIHIGTVICFSVHFFQLLLRYIPSDRMGLSCMDILLCRQIALEYNVFGPIDALTMV